MKKVFYTLLVITSLLTTSSCRKALKDVNDYFPKIKTVSATVQTDGSVLLRGEVDSKSEGNIEYLGFCCNTNGDPKIRDRQITVASNGTFSATYPGGFNVDSIYYFKAWATNEFGYSYGNTLRLDSIIATPITPPCTLTMNTLNLSGGQTQTYTSVTEPTEYMGTYEFSGSTGSTGVNFTFGSALTTGTYTTTTETSPEPGRVYINFYSGFTSGALSNGSKIYVNTIGSGIFDISICNAPWTNSGTTFYFNTRLTVPY